MPSYAWTVAWPGLARLWLRGDWAGLGTAMLFAAVVNGAIVTTCLWPALVGLEGPSVVFSAAVWMTVLCFWGASCWSSWRALPRLQPGGDARGDDALFLKAQTEYLRGHWYDAEQLLQRMLQEAPRDAEAHLLLATLYRHTERWEEARQRLRVVERLQGGSRWLFEVAEEERRLNLAMERADDERESSEG
jgi:hypothetical protein